MLTSNAQNASAVHHDEAIYRSRILEIEKDLELGRLDKVSAEAAMAEEGRRLLKVSGSEPTSRQTSSHKLVLLGLALFLPLFSLSIYQSIGSPGSAVKSNLAVSEQEAPSLEELVKAAESRLKSNPDDIRGWRVIAPVYLRLGRFADAINAYENVLRIDGRKVETVLALTDAHIAAANGRINEDAQALIREALKLEKNNATARFYSGVLAIQNGEPDKAVQIWQAMVDGANGDENWLPVVRERIAEITTDRVKPSAPALDEETLNAAAGLNAEERLAMISQMVENLSGKLEADPSDKAGWERLIRSYIVLERPSDAVAALERARSSHKDDVAFLAKLDTLEKEISQNRNGSEN